MQYPGAVAKAPLYARFDEFRPSQQSRVGQRCLLWEMIWDNWGIPRCGPAQPQRAERVAGLLVS
jgi:hypothetical protein